MLPYTYYTPQVGSYVYQHGFQNQLIKIVVDTMLSHTAHRKYPSNISKDVHS